MKPSVDALIEEVKKVSDLKKVGMILVHNGIVRGSSRSGKAVKEMELDYDEKKLKEIVSEFESREGIEAIKVWINRGRLKVGDDIMVVVVAGRFRTDVLPVFEQLISRIKKEVVVETECS
jgi:molybdopterin synthase catalytic subunit